MVESESIPYPEEGEMIPRLEGMYENIQDVDVRKVRLVDLSLIIEPLR